jgi:hypothetical protein
MPQSQFNLVPTYQVPLIVGGNTTRDWYFFFTGLFRGLPPENESPVTLDPSPATYSAPRKGSVIVSGGTVTLIEFTRNGTDYYDVGATSGMFAVNASDVLRITYAVVPDVTFVPS